MKSPIYLFPYGSLAWNNESLHWRGHWHMQRALQELLSSSSLQLERGVSWQQQAAGPMAVYNSEGSKPSTLSGEALHPHVWGKSLLIFSVAVQLTFGPGGRCGDRECAVAQGKNSVSILAGGLKGVLSGKCKVPQRSRKEKNLRKKTCKSLFNSWDYPPTHTYTPRYAYMDPS